jgi:hypothetical protein
MTVARQLKRALVDGLSDLFAALPDHNGMTRSEWRTEVTYGWPFGNAPAEVVYFGRARADTPPAAMRAGRNYRDESGELEIVVVCAAVGGSAEDADDRAHAHREAIETWIADRKNNELGVRGLQSLITTGWESTPAGNDNGHVTGLTVTVRWTARLT